MEGEADGEPPNAGAPQKKRRHNKGGLRSVLGDDAFKTERTAARKRQRNVKAEKAASGRVAALPEAVAIPIHLHAGISAELSAALASAGLTQLAAPIAELGIELLAELRDFSALQLESLLVRDASYHLKELQKPKLEKFLAAIASSPAEAPSQASPSLPAEAPSSSSPPPPSPAQTIEEDDEATDEDETVRPSSTTTQPPTTAGMTVVRAAENYILAWLNIPDEQDPQCGDDPTIYAQLDLPAQVKADDWPRLASFCEARGLTHETVNVEMGAIFRVHRRRAATSEVATSEAVAASAAAAAPAAATMTDTQRARAAANREAALARRAEAEAAAASPAAAPAAMAAPAATMAAPAVAPAPMPAPLESGQTRLDDLARVSSGSEVRDLSDSLGVSSALYLGASDLLKLRAMIENPCDVEHATRVLRRLSTVPMTSQLDGATGMRACLASLAGNETMQAAVHEGAEEAVEVAEVIARLIRVWEEQLEEEQRQRNAHAAPTPKPAPKPQRVKDPFCLACQGKHRAHTCK